MAIIYTKTINKRKLECIFKRAFKLKFDENLTRPQFSQIIIFQNELILSSLENEDRVTIKVRLEKGELVGDMVVESEDSTTECFAKGYFFINGKTDSVLNTMIM